MNILDFKKDFYTYTKNRDYQKALSLVDQALIDIVEPEKLITDGIAKILKDFQSYFDEGYENIS
ncbi:MAG: hypothetical protein P8Y70_14345 [Candidatus Lokiarchaeota archaeon]